MANNNYTTPTMAWDNLYNTYNFLYRQDAATADDKIVSYLDNEVNKAVEAGMGTVTELKARLRKNIVADKKCRFSKEIKNALGEKRKTLEVKLHLVAVFDKYTSNGGTVRTGGCTQYTATSTGGCKSKSKWQYRREELEQMTGNSLFWTSIYNNIASAMSKYEDKVAEYFGPDYYNIIMDAKDYARAMARTTKNGNVVIPAASTSTKEMTLEEKIAKGIPVVITPDVIAELAKLYPNVGAEQLVEYTEEDAAALEAEKKAIEEAKAKAAEEEAKAKAEAKAERERLAAEAAAKAKAKAEEKAKTEAEKPKTEETTEPDIPVDEEYMKALKRVNNRNMILDALNQRKEAKVATETLVITPVETTEPDAIVEDTPDDVTKKRAHELATIIKATPEHTIHGYELEVDWEDIDDTLEAIIAEYPDKFEYIEETDEIIYYPEEAC